MKERVLELLYQGAGTYVPGTKIAARLGISRTAVWKHIRKLQSEGYQIEASRTAGYALRLLPDLLLPAEIRRLIHTRSFGRHIHWHKSLGSTNDVAKNLGISGAPEGTLVVAEQQTRGRGRLGRSWVSPPSGGIWASLLLRPGIPPQEAPLLTLLSGVAVARALTQSAGLAVGIKWPNDILSRGRKLCGILTEMEAEMERVRFLVVGIGINANMLEEDFPGDMRDRSTSLFIELGRKVDRAQVLARVLDELERLYFESIERGYRPILEEWRKLNVTVGKEVRAWSGAERLQGVALDVDDDGGLIIRLDDGSLKKLFAGEVSLTAPWTK